MSDHNEEIKFLKSELAISKIKISELQEKLRQSRGYLESVIKWADEPVCLPFAVTNSVRDFLKK